jgi:hypothetical protein
MQTILKIKKEFLMHASHAFPLPYIGVTGFMTQEEVRAVVSGIPGHLIHLRTRAEEPEMTFRKIMIGVLMTQATLEGFPNGKSRRYPRKEMVARIFSDDPRVMNVIHYHTHDMRTLSEQLRSALALSAAIDGFQLNMRWPAIDSLRLVKDDFPFLRIILQIDAKAMGGLWQNAETLFRKIAGYAGVVDHVLFDMSRGKGALLSLDPWFIALLKTTARKLEKEGILVGIAGGLDDVSVRSLNPLIYEMRDKSSGWNYARLLSTDAEGRLRDEHDTLDTGKALRYIMECNEMLSMYASDRI